MKDVVISIISKNCALDDEININSDICDLSLDSLSFVNVIVELEDTFNIEFDIDDLNIKNWIKVSDIVRSVEVRVNEKK